MMKDNQVWEDCFSTPLGRLANVFVRTLSGGLPLKHPFAAVASFRFLTGSFIANCPIAFRSFPSFTLAATHRAGGIA